MCSAIRALDVRGGKFVAATSKGEIMYGDTATHAASSVVQGHWLDETWALAVHPSSHVFVTGGDEGTVRLWSGSEHKQIAIADLGVGVRGLSWSPDAQTIAAGTLKGEVCDSRGAAFNSLRLLTAIVRAGCVAERQRPRYQSRAPVAKTSVDEIKFCRAIRSLLAATTRSSTSSTTTSSPWASSLYACIEMFLPESAVLTRKLWGHHEAVWHFDWSADGANLQTNSRGYELLFCTFAASDAPRSATSDALCRGHEHLQADHLCVRHEGRAVGHMDLHAGLARAGIWPKYADGTDVNSVDRSHDGRILVTGDDFQNVNIFRYPCLTKGVCSTRCVS